RVITHEYGSDSAAVAYDAIAHAKARGYDVVLIDTAGRMQTDRNLMDELKKIKRVSEPDLTILVVDALTGNDAVSQAINFDENVGIDAIVLTKVDADEKGGVALTVVYSVKKPIIFVGTGQGYDDLEPFSPEFFLRRVFR
ncbi:MAG: signal recognition particle-docking protein FtsY, partial [Candidatus Asgardarchaeia archaeon]